MPKVSVVFYCKPLDGFFSCWGHVNIIVFTKWKWETKCVNIIVFSVYSYLVFTSHGDQRPSLCN